MIRVAFFPYHPDLRLVVKHKEKLENYEIVGVISYKEDKVLVEKLYHELEIEQLPYNLILESCDQIVLLDNYRNYKTDRYRGTNNLRNDNKPYLREYWKQS